MLDDQFKQQERPQDRDNQADVLRRLCAFKGPSYSFEQTVTGSAFDGFIFDGIEPAALVEVKCRTCTFAAFAKEGYRIDKSKIKKLLRCGGVRGVPPVLAVRWKCGVYGYVNLNMLSVDALPSNLVKRGDRDELPDMQVDIPMSAFTIF